MMQKFKQQQFKFNLKQTNIFRATIAITRDLLIQQTKMIEQEQNNDYLLQVQKLMSYDVASTYWSHNMDLLVIVTVQNLLQLYRINFKAQKVFQVQEDKQITAVCFSPDSQFIAYGTNDGQSKVLKTQNGQTLLTVNDPLNEGISSFSFSQYGKYAIGKIFPFKQSSSIMQKLILQISPHKNCNKGSIIKLNYMNQLTDQDAFTILVSSSDKHTSLHLNGFITIAQISYNSIAQKYFNINNNCNDYRVHFSHFNQQTYKLQSILIQNTPQSYIINLVQFNSSILKDMKPNIIKFNSLLGYISQIILFVQQAYPAAQLILRDIIRQYIQVISRIQDPMKPQVNACTQLFNYLNCGLTSPQLINFLTKQIYDSKMLQKLDQTVNSMFNNLHDLLLQSVQNSLQRTYLLILQLKALSKLEKYELFNINNQQLQKIQKMIQKLYTMGQMLLVQSTQAKFDIRNLLVWLNKASIKTASDPTVQIQNTKSYLGRYTVDFTRLHAFLQSQNYFKMQNLKDFFSKGNQTHTMRIPQCQFRLLNRLNNPEFNVSLSYKQETKKIQRLLDLQDIILPRQEKMSIQMSYKSFKLQLQQLKQQWKKLKIKPSIAISKSIQQTYQITKIGQVQASQIVAFDIKTIVKKNQLKTNNQLSTHNQSSMNKSQQRYQSQLILYWIDHNKKGNDLIVEYNTRSKIQRTISLPLCHQALAISVGVDIILLTENPQSMHEQKSIVQVVNQQWNNQQLIVGKRIDKLTGQILINAGLRGLNLMIVNKNKLVVFD